FEPLGMKDTAFHVPAEKLERFTASYMGGTEPGELHLHDGIEDSAWRHAPAFCSAASGLVSTAEDVLVFAQMMLDGGKHGRHRILSRPTIEAMSVDQITPEQKRVSPFFPGFWSNTGWGLGFSIVTGPDATPALPGRRGWDGGLGTSCYWDPREGCVGVLLTQLAVTSANAQAIRQDFWTSVYRAFDD
ncbi:MAG TPA: serine hydrolase, partial [Polyangiaceae bacterium]